MPINTKEKMDKHEYTKSLFLNFEETENNFIKSLKSQFDKSGSLSENQFKKLEEMTKSFQEIKNKILIKLETQPESEFYNSLLHQLTKKGSLSPKQIECLKPPLLKKKTNEQTM